MTKNHRDQVIHHFNSQKDRLVAHYDTVNRAYVVEPLLPFIKAANDPQGTPLLCLDIGAGGGHDADFFAATFNMKVLAIDPSEQLLQTGKDKFTNPAIEWRVDHLPTLTACEDQKGKADFIVLSAVWQYLAPDERIGALKRLNDLLKPGGHMLILYPTPPSRELQEAISEQTFKDELKSCPDLEIVHEKIHPDFTHRKALNGEDLYFLNFVMRKNSKP